MIADEVVKRLGYDNDKDRDEDMNAQDAILQCDYLVVGAGSAGCVMANRLSESGKYNVVLLEAGGSDNHPWLHIPIGYAKVYQRPKFNWLYATEPEDALHGRAAVIPRGKVLGGSSAVNGMVYIRGQKEDFDHWRQLGNAGWSFDDVLPYFRKAEDQARGEDAFHGTDGPLKVSDAREPHSLCDAFVAAAGQAGVPANSDFNGARQEGAGYIQHTSHNGRRWSAATAYLNPAKRRHNLHIVTDALVKRVLLAGKRAVGVHCSVKGKALEIRAGGEVILCAGAIATPQLLQVSGIGPAEHLMDSGIAIKHDLPGIGAALQDHFAVHMPFHCRQPITMNDGMRSMIGKARMAALYAFRRKGPFAYGAGYAGAFLRTRVDVASPDFQLIMLLFTRTQKITELDPFSGFTVLGYKLRPDSRGSVRIVSEDMRDPPRVHFGYLSAATDLDTTLGGFRALGRIMNQDAFAPYYGGSMQIDLTSSSDEELTEYIRNKGVSAQHAAGTCAMGSGKAAVVDERLRVHGIDRLRVVDASVMPSITSGNTNASVIMIAEKAADMMRADAERQMA